MPKRKSSIQSKCKETYVWIKEGRNDHHAECNLCQKEFSVAGLTNFTYTPVTFLRSGLHWIISLSTYGQYRTLLDITLVKQGSSTQGWLCIFGRVGKTEFFTKNINTQNVFLRWVSKQSFNIWSQKCTRRVW